MKKRKTKATLKGYRSGFERDLGRKLTSCDYEPKYAIQEYTSSHKYNPDFVPRDNPNLLIEAKGRFRTRSEASKYLHVQECNPEVEIVFIFMAPNRPMPGARRRKDGTKLSHGEWAESNGFTYYTTRNLPEEWCK